MIDRRFGIPAEHDDAAFDRRFGIPAEHHDVELLPNAIVRQECRTSYFMQLSFIGFPLSANIHIKGIISHFFNVK